MSGIILSSSVRQNLLSLQSTADLLSTTQNRLATGKKVNSALDNPTNYFTASALDSRASDINTLLDGIGNGVQILQAANTGITSLQKLVDSAKSIANQALQTTAGYSTKSNVSTTITGATADDLRGTTTFASASAIGSVVTDGTAGGATAISSATTLGGIAGALVGAAAPDGAGTATPNSPPASPCSAPRAPPPLRSMRHLRTATFWSSMARPSPSGQVRLRPTPGFPPAPASAEISSPTAAATPRFTSAPRRRRQRPYRTS